MSIENEEASVAANNKRIAKNTIVLYIRMIFMMGVSLFTSRVILQTLGVEDFGIYSVVGGIITMFAFINGGMVSATQRFITFEIGKGNIEKLRTVFSTSLQIHGLISILIVLLGETVGLWFLYEKMVIPENRMVAAMWVYQCSIIACVVNIMSIPYNADIVAHEKMSAFAYISIIEVSLKLIIVYMLLITPWDKLIVYSLLLLMYSFPFDLSILIIAIGILRRPSIIINLMNCYLRRWCPLQDGVFWEILLRFYIHKD